jgi:hypothetical protein
MAEYVVKVSDTFAPHGAFEQVERAKGILSAHLKI